MNFILPVSNSINYRNLNDDLQLVSVIIVTYNSGKYVLETLESVKQQTYKKIELIVTDDHSNDDTVEICQNWLNQNNKYFVRTELITSTRNTGIAPNCNRGLKASKGLWLKFFAGDDILLENCIALFMDFVLRNPNCKVLFGKLFYLKEGVLKEEVKNKIFTQTQKKQYLTILKGSSINAPSCFHNRELLIKLGGFDEKYPFFEDAPLWIKMAENGIYFYYIDEFVVKYRLHEHQTSGFLNRKYFINKVFYYEKERIFLNEVLPRMVKKRMYFSMLHIYNYIIVNRIILADGNQYNLMNRVLNYLIIKSTILKITRFIFLKGKSPI